MKRATSPSRQGQGVESRDPYVEFGKYVGMSSGFIAAIETERSSLTDQVSAKIENKCECDE